MAGRQLSQNFSEYQKLIRLDPLFHMKPKTEQAASLGISRHTLDSWIDRTDWENVRDCNRKAFAKLTPRIDAALIGKCLKGNVGAIQLYYERHEAWRRSAAVDLSVSREDEELRNASPDFLLAKALSGVPEEDREKILEMAKNLPDDADGRPFEQRFLAPPRPLPEGGEPVATDGNFQTIDGEVKRGEEAHEGGSGDNEPERV